MDEERSNSVPGGPVPTTPRRQIRAVYADATITVYQAYSSRIADPALRSQRLMPPFQTDRMTWIKPSFLWMMYRSGWGTKEGQERVLAIDITRSGFQWCLENGCLSHFEPAIHASQSVWRQAKEQSPVRVQWDPERSIRLERLDHRSIQIGLSGEAVARYVDDWIVRIRDVTPLVREIHQRVAAGAVAAAEELLPREIHYPAVALHLGLAS